MKPKIIDEDVASLDSIKLEHLNSDHDKDTPLYSKGEASDDFYLILQGKVIVESGSEGFLVQLSTFSYFGLDSLLNDQYIPDFTARVAKYARLLKIKRIDYMRAIASVENFS